MLNENVLDICEYSERGYLRTTTEVYRKVLLKKTFYIPTRIACVLLCNIAGSVWHGALFDYACLNPFCKFITSFDSIDPLAEEVI
jgi:hypothetical protein